MNNNEYFGKSLRNEVAKHLPQILETHNILEIGCGEGAFIKNLQKHNEYWGIEPNKHAAENAKKALTNVLCGKYSEISNLLPDNYFDLVICNDVIEHMEDAEEMLLSIRTKIKKSGFLVASIPNVRHITNLYNLLIKKDWLYTDSGILDRTHLRFYTKRSIRNLFESNGYSINKLVGINEFNVINTSSRESIKRLVAKVACIIMGNDTKYRQFFIMSHYNIL